MPMTNTQYRTAIRMIKHNIDIIADKCNDTEAKNELKKLAVSLKPFLDKPTKTH